jgi:hypothetical protein
VFSFQGLDPENFIVELHDGRTVTVPLPIVDFADSMPSILNDREVMKFVMKGINPNTFCPYTSAEEHENDPGDAIIDDKDSSWLFRQGIELHCPDDVDPKKVRLFPVLMHIDCSHAALFGNFKVAPVQVMPAILDVNVQQTTAAWRKVATIPNLSAGKGKDGKSLNLILLTSCRIFTRS